MIAYYLIDRVLVVEQGVAVFAVFVLNSFKVQKHLVDKYYAVDQYYSNYLFVCFSVLLLVLIEVIFIFGKML